MRVSWLIVFLQSPSSPLVPAGVLPLRIVAVAAVVSDVLPAVSAAVCIS